MTVCATTPPRRNSDWDRPASRETVLRIAHQHQLVLVQRHRDDVRVAQRSDQPHLDLVVEHHGQDLFGVPGAHGHVDARVQVRESLQHGGQDIRADRRGSAERKSARAG